jgi:hypothetical protein
MAVDPLAHGYTLISSHRTTALPSVSTNLSACHVPALKAATITSDHVTAEDIAASHRDGTRLQENTPWQLPPTPLPARNVWGFENYLFEMLSRCVNFHMPPQECERDNAQEPQCHAEIRTAGNDSAGMMIASDFLMMKGKIGMPLSIICTVCSQGKDDT